MKRAGAGSDQGLTDGSGTVIQTYQTDAFGVPTSIPGTQGSASQPFGYTGQQVDATGLVYLRAPYYVPALGRVLTRDAVVGSLRAPLSLNRFTYLANDPRLTADPSGLAPAGPTNGQVPSDSSTVGSPAKSRALTDNQCFSSANGSFHGELANPACLGYWAAGQGSLTFWTLWGTFFLPVAFVVGTPPPGGAACAVTGSSQHR